MEKREYPQTPGTHPPLLTITTSVIQRQNHLISIGYTPAGAYDLARKEYYRFRHAQETEVRVAREEALASGAFFGPGPNEVGMKLEDKQYEHWKAWAKKEAEALAQLQAASYTGVEVEGAAADAVLEPGDEMGMEELQAVSESVPASKAGQDALGGVAVHP
jgi:small subunit ribosomal protein S23